MAEILVSTRLYDSLSVASLSRESIAFLAVGGSRFARHGALSTSDIRSIGFSTKHADAVVDAGLWSKRDDLYEPTGPHFRIERHRTTIDRKAILNRDGWRCRYCGCDLTPGFAHIDHVVPLSRGGTNDDSNLCSACPPCNLSKHAKTPEEWLGTA